MSPLSFYFLLKLDSIALFSKAICATLFLLIGCGLIISIGSAAEYKDAAWKVVKSQLKWSLPVACFFLLVYFLLPSTKQMAAIIVVPKVISSIEANKELMSLPNDITSLASSWINELHPKAVKESAKTIVQQMLPAAPEAGLAKEAH